MRNPDSASLVSIIGKNKMLVNFDKYKTQSVASTLQRVKHFACFVGVLELRT